MSYHDNSCCCLPEMSNAIQSFHDVDNPQTQPYILSQPLPIKIDPEVATEDVFVNFGQKAIEFVNKLEANPNDIIVNAGVVGFAHMGEVRHSGLVETYAFKAGQRIIVNARTFLGAANGITNRKTILSNHHGRGPVESDSTSFNVCKAANIVNHNSSKAVVGIPPPGYNMSRFSNLWRNLRLRLKSVT